MVEVSVGDSIKQVEVLLAMCEVGEMSCCCSTGCLSCRGKQSTSSSSSSGTVAGVSGGDSMRLLQLGTAVGRDAVTVDVEYQGGLGGIGLGGAVEGVGNPMVISVV